MKGFFKPTFLSKNEQTSSPLLLVDLFSFVFWKKVKTPQRHFEINWPLEYNEWKKGSRSNEKSDQRKLKKESNTLLRKTNLDHYWCPSEIYTAIHFDSRQFWKYVLVPFLRSLRSKKADGSKTGKLSGIWVWKKCSYQFLVYVCRKKAD